ncbi:MAG: LytTR family transcriptional regulator DNA-binding domain-containing protein [Lachnospiraceae bacterium]|nr:LytTR family transcriptional regulator DNA-binding domain-containing protein [Lachnospiraceae bacterium]
MYIAVLADNIADRKQTERLLGRANDVLANETGTLYIDSYGDAKSLMRAPMKYELFFLDIYGAEDHGRSVIDALKSANVPGKIALVLPEDIPFSYQNAIEGLLTIQKPLITTTLHQLIKDAHKEQIQTVVPKVEIRSENETYYVPLEQIIYAQEINHFVYVHLDNGSTLTMLGEIRDFYRWVNNHKEFVQIKKDTVLNLNHVISSSKKEYHMSNGEVITLPRFSFLKPQQ